MDVLQMNEWLRKNTTSETENANAVGGHPPDVFNIL